MLTPAQRDLIKFLARQAALEYLRAREQPPPGRKRDPGSTAKVASRRAAG